MTFLKKNGKINIFFLIYTKADDCIDLAFEELVNIPNSCSSIFIYS